MANKTTGNYRLYTPTNINKWKDLFVNMAEGKLQYSNLYLLPENVHKLNKDTDKQNIDEQIEKITPVAVPTEQIVQQAKTLIQPETKANSIKLVRKNLVKKALIARKHLSRGPIKVSKLKNKVHSKKSKHRGKTNKK
jgi:hypothetical protein